ncbi:MAG: SDR family oxidoreductase [Salibacteraceae bacterium]
MRLREKTIWVTGASSGIGEALVRELATRGNRLIISARNRAKLETIAQELDLPPENVLVLPLDLSQPERCTEWVDQVLQHMGPIDLMIHNGGISQRSRAVETDWKVDERLMVVDYLGTVALTKALLPHFLERKAGHFAVVSSLVGKFGTPLRSGYAAAKHALHGFFDSLRAELWQENIRVTLVCPGFIYTQVSINALGADGKATGVMDEAQAKGMPAAQFARKMIHAIEAEKREVNIGGKEKYAVLLKRFFPGIFAKMIQTAKVT